MLNTLLAPAVGLYRHRHTALAMGALAASGLRRRRQKPLPTDLEQRSLVSGRVPAYDPALGTDFMRVTGADPTAYRLPDGGTCVPHTYYVTWAMAAMAQSLVRLGLPYDYSRVLHAASEFDYQRLLRTDEAAYYRARVVSIDDNERRARIRVEMIVSERDVAGEEIFRNVMEMHLPKARKKASGGVPHRAPIVAPTMRPLYELRLGRELGRDYALVSGDFNPVHWSQTVAHAMGFKATFVQGYCTKAMIANAIVQRLLGGAGHDLLSLRVEFKKPIYLPASPQLFIAPAAEIAGRQHRELAVGTAREADALVTGSFSYRGPAREPS